MDHVRVGLDAHEGLDLDRAVLAHAPEVVAAEVDEHHVLGALLLVGQQLGGDPLVLLGVGAARAGAGDRAGGDVAAGDGDQRLGRGADDLEVLEVEEVHVRRRVDRAQAAVDRERLDRHGRADQRCEGTTWKASPACTYSTIRATIASNASRGMLDSNCGSGRGADGSLGAGQRAGEPLAHLADRLDGARVRGLHPAVLVDVGVGEDRHRVAQVVEGERARRRASAPCPAGRARRGWARPGARPRARSRSRRSRRRRPRTAAGRRSAPGGGATPRPRRARTGRRRRPGSSARRWRGL